MSVTINVGDHCWADCTAPARYIGHGLCLFVSAQDNSIGCDDMSRVRLDPVTHTLPVPTDEEVYAAHAVVVRMWRS